MIGWLVDRWWLWKNRDALREVDAQMDGLRAEGERLDRRLQEMFGPDWRRDAEERLKRLASIEWTTA